MKVSLLLLCSLATLVVVIADSEERYFKNSSFRGVQFERHVVGKNGNLKFFAGDQIVSFSPKGLNSNAEIIAQLKDLLDLQGSETFVRTRTEEDFKGHKHHVYQQYNRGLEVDGGELILHITAGTSSAFAVTSSVLPDTLDNKPSVDAHKSLKKVLQEPILGEFAGRVLMEEEPTLTYLIFDDQGYLVWRSLISYVDYSSHNITKKTKLYVDATNGRLILNSPLFMAAKNREVYTAGQKTSLPGTISRKEGQAAVNDQMVNAAYDNSGVCYDYYKTTFNRDSIDNKGGKLISTVHYSSKYNNAFWDGTQMVYGDGDGVTFSDFAADLSVVCHELTHAVTSKTSNLRYQGESGALNEGMSDIFGASATIYRDGLNQNSWLIGHDCYLQGDALRYMNNPILDKSSYDWYPSRYTGSSDNGGVHWNSGIANLAYVLMVQGGVHPQQKSTNWVEEIGVSQSQQIMYSALTAYMTTSTTFAGARAATETAAKALYGTTATATVSAAWTAVGVN